MLRLENKVAIVTGGASGIGRAIVERFREEGATVCVFDIKGGEDCYEVDVTKEDMIILTEDIRCGESAQTRTGLTQRENPRNLILHGLMGSVEFAC